MAHRYVCRCSRGTILFAFLYQPTEKMYSVHLTHRVFYTHTATRFVRPPKQSSFVCWWQIACNVHVFLQYNGGTYITSCKGVRRTSVVDGVRSLFFVWASDVQSNLIILENLFISCDVCREPGHVIMFLNRSSPYLGISPVRYVSSYFFATLNSSDDS